MTDNTPTSGTMDLELIRENPDGSAVYAFNLSPADVTAFTRLGIITVLKAAIADAERYNPTSDVE